MFLRRVSVVAIGLTCALSAVAPAAGQLAERPGTSADTSAGPKDLSGLSIKTPRVRAVHTTDDTLVGGTMYLQVFDPFLAWKRGKDLTQREFRVRDGVFENDGVSRFRGTLPDGETPAIVGNDQVSCGGCHNMPYRDAGAGTNFAKKAGLGRNATHFYGSGIQEMLAWQIRQKMMQQIDTNRNGWVDAGEMTADAVLVAPRPGAAPIDYGSSGDADSDGQPDLNNIFRVWFVDATGTHLPAATSLSSPGVAGYNFILEVFGWGEKRFSTSTPPTGSSRGIPWSPMAASRPTIRPRPSTPTGTASRRSRTRGFQQSPIGHVPPDLGTTLSPGGLSLDDPDGDGVINEISEGDLDLIEWYMLNSPRPGKGRQTAETALGDQLFDQWGCASCHVSDWLIEAADPGNPDIPPALPGRPAVLRPRRGLERGEPAPRGHREPALHARRRGPARAQQGQLSWCAASARTSSTTTWGQGSTT